MCGKRTIPRLPPKTPAQNNSKVPHYDVIRILPPIGRASSKKDKSALWRNYFLPVNWTNCYANDQVHRAQKTRHYFKLL